MKNGKFVYKTENALQRMHDFYDKTLANLQVPFSEDYFETSFGKTHSLGKLKANIFHQVK